MKLDTGIDDRALRVVTKASESREMKEGDYLR